MTDFHIGIMPVFAHPFIGDAGWVTRFLAVAEAAGCESVWTAEHPLVAEDYEPRYSYTEDGRAPLTAETVFPDPLDWLAFAAGVTSRIRLATGVLLLPLHSPVLLAKRVATIDLLSGGRVLLGVGLGWQIEEFRAIGVPYEERGRRMDEGIDVLRALWTGRPASYRGRLFGFERVHSEPKPPGGTVPILVGGSTTPAARRAGRLGDGWFPHAISPEDMALRLEEMRQAAIDAGRDPAAIELTVAPWSWKNGARDLGLMRAYAQLGVRRFVLSPFDYGGGDLDQTGRFIHRFRDDILARL